MKWGGCVGAERKGVADSPVRLLSGVRVKGSNDLVDVSLAALDDQPAHVGMERVPIANTRVGKCRVPKPSLAKGMEDIPQAANKLSQRNTKRKIPLQEDAERLRKARV